MTNRLRPDDSFLRLVFVFQGLLIASTWPLWFSKTQFPRVPLLEIGLIVPWFVDFILSLLLVGFCVLGAFTRNLERPDKAKASTMRRYAISCLICGGVLAITSQQRLQPWHWLFLLIQLQTLLPTSHERRRIYRLTFASIYIFAALSRMGPLVASGMSYQVLQTLLEFLSLGKLAENSSFVTVACWLMSVSECLIGIALLWNRSRKAGVIAAVALHSSLLLALGPLGLNHHWGVLLWNLLLMLCVPLLFWNRQTTISAEPHQTSWKVRVMMVLVFGFPASALVGIADNWLGWQVYSPRTDVVRLFVRTDAIEVLPQSCHPFVGEPLPLQEFSPVRIDRWSLSETNSPLYPEDRFQLAVVANMVRDLPPSAYKITLRSASKPDWWNQKRVPISDVSAATLQRQFLLNTNAIMLANPD